MKFRAVMIDAGPMREFSNVVTIISKLSKECVLRLSDDQLYFIVSEENSGPTPPILWCEIPHAMFFSEYQMIGIDDEHKDIYLAISSGNLARSLVTLKSAKSLKMKLTKKQCPCLTLEIEMPSIFSQQTKQVTHDIPVTVIPRKLWSDFHEPRVPDPDVGLNFEYYSSMDVLMNDDDESPCCIRMIYNVSLIQTEDYPTGEGPTVNVQNYIASSCENLPSEPQKLQISIELPSLKQLRTTIDRMKTMCSEVVIRASAEGRLTLQIKTDMAKVSTRFKDLRVEAFGGPIDHSDSETETQVNEDMSRVCYCRVDAKKLSMFLSADQISSNRTMCSIVNKKLVILCLQTDDNVKLQCFISGIVY